MKARLLLTTGLIAIVVAAAGSASARQSQPPANSLTVALSMPTPGFQVGAVRGRDVVVARGLEIDLARAIAARMGIRRVRFVNEPVFLRLTAAGPKEWDFALAEVTILPQRRARVDFSVPYLRADLGVLARKNLTPVPRSIAALRRLKLCSERGSTGGLALVNRVKPTRPAQLVPNVSVLLQRVQTGACDAAVFDAPILGALRAGAPDRYGPLIGRIATGERYGVVFEKGSGLRPSVNQALQALLRNGTVAKLQRRWLTTNVAKLPLLR
jgi:polar amino acid transport system substrate-binding protein